jgi:hypothetical protein
VDEVGFRIVPDSSPAQRERGVAQASRVDAGQAQVERLADDVCMLCTATPLLRSWSDAFVRGERYPLTISNVASGRPTARARLAARSSTPGSMRCTSPVRKSRRNRSISASASGTYAPPSKYTTSTRSPVCVLDMRKRRASAARARGGAGARRRERERSE